ncbi:MAG: ferredoxin family protein [Pseudomonadota bacterium]
MKKMSIEEKLALDKFVVDDDHPHIIVKAELCAACDFKPCTVACPASLYKLDDKGQIQFDFAGCLECGTCRIICPQGAIEWNYPRPTYGVFFRYG